MPYTPKRQPLVYEIVHVPVNAIAHEVVVRICCPHRKPMYVSRLPYRGAVMTGGLGGGGFVVLPLPLQQKSGRGWFGWIW